MFCSAGLTERQDYQKIMEDIFLQIKEIFEG